MANLMTRGPRAPSSQEVRRVVIQNLHDWNTPRSLSLYLLMEHGTPEDYSSLMDYSPAMFTSARCYAEFSLPMDLISKIRIAGVIKRVSDPEAKARSRFIEAEAICRETNRRLRYGHDPEGRLGELVRRVRKNVSTILGPVTPELLDSLVEGGGWGNGCTSTVKRSTTEGWLTFHQKLTGTQQSTTAFSPVARKLQCEILGMGPIAKVPRDYNKVSFVPKNWKTHRAIAVEPSLNAFVQRGVGRALSRRLRRHGCDLSNGWARNQRLALEGSRTGLLSTIDLSMASDTLAFKTVKYLIEDSSWVSLLELLRTPNYEWDDKIVPYQKWSSMGNGYTFELESLIFLCCVKATVEPGDDYAVYGDDLVLPTRCVEDLADLLSYLGFIFNPDKSFSTGSFRESCGEDYFDGIGVRGFYLKDSNPELWYTWHNWLLFESVLPKCTGTMRLLQRLAGTVTFAPCPIPGAFCTFPLPNKGMQMVRGRKYGRIGWWFNRVVFEPNDRPLSVHTDIGAVSAHCRLAHGGESIERPPIRETRSESGKWKQRRTFVDDRVILDHPWRRTAVRP